ncbi:class I SAM-dependent methyltransferase [Nanoarchaeota archaeon]
MTQQKKFWERESLKKRRSWNHPAVIAFVKPKIKDVVRIIGRNKKLTLLDVGCGNGFFTKPFSRIYNTKGVDFSERMVSLNPVKNCEVQNATKLKEKNSSFDIVFCSNLLHHLEKPTMAVKEMKRVSKKYVVLSEPNRNNPLMFPFLALIKEERGALKQNQKYLTELCRKAGLKVIKVKTMGAIVPNKTPAWAVRFFKLFDNIPFFGFFILVIAKK